MKNIIQNAASDLFEIRIREWHGKFDAMFDNLYHNQAMYHSEKCDPEFEKSVVINFKEPVRFHDIKMYTRIVVVAIFHTF